MQTYKIKELHTYKDLEFELELEYYYDENVHEYYEDVYLGDLNFKRVRNEYRRLKGLLFDYEIQNIRKQYGLSQRDYSIALGFGEVTITRYETKTVQEKAHDKVIRQSKNPELFLGLLEDNKDKYIEVNGLKKYNDLYNLVERLSKDIDFLMNQYNIKYRGNTEFGKDKLKAVISYIKDKKNILTKTFLAKVLWYIDCLSYNQINKSMTGLVYKSMPYGAYPMLYDQILADADISVKESWYNDYECYLIEKVNSKGCLDERDKKYIEYIISIFKDYNSKEIVTYMHNEKAYKETELFKIISYEYANEIEIFKNFK